MDLRYLRYFVAVAEEMNFTHAAERLHTVQPSLSRQIQRLEEMVGTPLFRRNRHGLKLTEAGRIFLDESRAILQQMDRAIASARQGARAEAGHISMGFIVGTEMRIVSKFLPTLKVRCPEMKISFHTLGESELIEALENEKINVAFTGGVTTNPGIASEVVLRQRIVVLLPAAHPLARTRKIAMASLADMCWIRPSDPTYVQSLTAIATREGVSFSSAIENDNVLSAIHAVGLGLGFAFVPDYQRDILPSSIVARPLSIEPPPTIDVSMAYRKDDRTPALAFFLSIVRECMAASTSNVTDPQHPEAPPKAKAE
jgi:LysR family hca operon transcriptional activator